MQVSHCLWLTTKSTFYYNYVPQALNILHLLSLFVNVGSVSTPEQEPGCNAKSVANGGIASVLARPSVQQERMITNVKHAYLK